MRNASGEPRRAEAHRSEGAFRLLVSGSAEALAAAHKPLHSRDNRAAGALLRGTTEDVNEGGSELPGTAPR
jgi:hypothetical protein